MRKLVVPVLAVLSFAVSAVCTSTSSAFEWLCGGQAILTAKNCAVLELNLEVSLVQDRGTAAEIECPVEAIESEGSILNTLEGEITKIQFTGCKAAAKARNLKEEQVTNACEKLESIKANNLPWTSKIEEEEGATWWILVFKAKAEPGFAFVCKTILGNVEDVCTAQEAHTVLVLGVNLAETETIEGVAGILLFDIFFPRASETLEGSKESATCTVGGQEQGDTIGEHLLWGLIGGKAASLEIS